MIFVGIDPGKSGAMAVLVDNAGPGLDVEIWPTPMIPGSQKNRDTYDLVEIRNRLETLAAERELFVTLESSGWGAGSNSRRFDSGHRGTRPGASHSSSTWKRTTSPCPNLVLSCHGLSRIR